MSWFTKTIYDDSELKSQIVELRNKVWKLEHPAKFKTNDKAEYVNGPCGAPPTIVTIVREEFKFSGDGLINHRLYLIILKDSDSLVHEYALKEHKK